MRKQYFWKPEEIFSLNFLLHFHWRENEATCQEARRDRSKNTTMYQSVVIMTHNSIMIKVRRGFKTKGLRTYTKTLMTIIHHLSALRASKEFATRRSCYKHEVKAHPKAQSALPKHEKDLDKQASTSRS